MLDKQKLKQWAIALEHELDVYRDQSKDVADLCEYHALTDAIEKAKAEAIEAPIELRALSHFFFETRLRNYRDLTHALNCFSLLLEGYVLPPG